MKPLLFTAAACLSLSACSTTSIDTAIQKNLPAICSAAGTAHAAFVAVSAAGTIKPKTVAKEAAAWAALEPLCAAPQDATAASVLVKAAEAYATITIALREAKEG